MTSGRVKLSARNSKINLLGYLASILLGFFSRRIFLNYLGTDFVGLTGIVTNILGFLNLAELGFSVAVAYTLYKPLQDDDRTKICEIISLFRIIYIRVGSAIFILGIFLSALIPIFFNKNSLDLLLIYTCFYGFLFSSLIGYFLNYRQLLLTANQRNYIVVGLFQLSKIIKSLLQMWTAYYLRNPYIWILLEVLFSVCYSWILNRKIFRYYPWLKQSERSAKDLFKAYPSIIQKSRQVFIHRIKDVLLTQSDQILIFYFVSLTMVAYYGNYMMIISSLSTLFLTTLDSMSASVGNLVAAENKNYIKKIFWQLLALRYFTSGILVFGIFYYIDPLITVWLGSQYIMDRDIVNLMVLVTLIITSRGVVDMFNAAYGNFSDTWSAWVEGTINLSVSIICAQKFGIIGLLYGKLASLVPIILIWKPIYLYRMGFKSPSSEYFKRILVYALAFILCFVIGKYVKQECFDSFLPDSASSIINLLLSLIVNVSFFSSIYFVIFYLFFDEFRQLIYRIIPMRRNR